MLERAHVSKIIGWLHKQCPGCYLIKLESPSTSGILDLYFAYRGRSIWFEVKKPEYRFRTWKNKKIQQWHHRQLRQNGVEAYFVFGLEDVQQIMAPVLTMPVKRALLPGEPRYVFVEIPGNN